jgi:predicted dehydrogenase
MPIDKSRRDFLKTATTAAVATAVAPSVDLFPAVHAAGSDAVRVGLIGCGGRGTGAAQDVLSSAQGVTLVAMGDVFPDRLNASRDRLRDKFADKIAVTADRSFTGFDAYKNVLASDINYVILATPPGFRPTHLSAAVAAGKNIFTEKPVAVDGPGIRTVLALYDEAKAKGLGVVAGTQRRHQTGYIETMRRIHDGSIGNVVGARCYWNQGFLWKKDRQPEWSDMEWQLRNWLYFTWLSGDHIVEQHVHNLDVVNWAMQAHPVRAVGMGGRQVRTGPEYGHIFDHFAIDYEYANGTRLMSMCRQIEGCEKNVSEALVGDKGSCQTEADKQKYEITGPRAWRFTAEDSRPYVQEHTDFIASIRAGTPLNELKTVAESTLTAIMGRMSAYTGKAVTWDQALNSQEALVPASMTFGPIATPPVAVPGQTPLV